MISSNHYQAPVRRFVLDLFDIPLDPDSLEELVKMEQTSLHMISSVQASNYGYRRSELRRRSASSPGPEPAHNKDNVARPGTRHRGLTISRMEGQEQIGGVAKERISGGFGVMLD